MNCIIIEDQPPAQRILKKYIEEIGSLELKGVFSNALQAIDFLKMEPVDLIFLDVHLPKMSGIEFLKTLTEPPAIILTTAFSDYALEGYELDITDYLLKPFSFQRFVKAVNKVPGKDMLQGTSNPTPAKDLFIKSGHDYIRIELEDLLYIKSDADYTELYTEEKKYLSSEPLRNWVQNIGNEQFVRVHKSYIVNTSKIEKISGNQIYLIKGGVIPIGRVYKEEFLNRFVNK
ncbi:MAG: LytTR family DNA-binding domain-containing protein [Bacteroidia bacterium]|nr:LytTR family DNA-binding domain-containing protein [Bacteroidia bacterium]